MAKSCFNQMGMKRKSLLFFLIFLWGCSHSNLQIQSNSPESPLQNRPQQPGAPAQQGKRRVSADQEASDLFRAVALVQTRERLYTRGIEGPAVDSDGNIYAVALDREGTIGVHFVGQESTPQVWLTLPDGGRSTSVLVAPQNKIYIADYIKHRIYVMQKSALQPNPQPVMLVENAEMNQPNDMTLLENGTLFLSDPTWAKGKQGHIWRLSPQGILEKALTGLKAPNGIDFSPDEKTLYYTDSIEGRLYACDVPTPTQVKNCKVLVQMDRDTVDGIKTDIAGNIYVTRIMRGKIERYSATGQLNRTITLNGQEPTNITFGGPNGTWLYVTLRDRGNLDVFQAEFPGRVWSLSAK